MVGDDCDDDVTAVHYNLKWRAYLNSSKKNSRIFAELLSA